MQRAYQEYNDAARASGKTRGHFVIDLSRPGHLTGCLRAFQDRICASDDNWDALFSEHSRAGGPTGRTLLHAVSAAHAAAMGGPCMPRPSCAFRVLLPPATARAAFCPCAA